MSGQSTNGGRMMRRILRVQFACAMLAVATTSVAQRPAPAMDRLVPYTNAWQETFQPDSGSRIGPFLWEDRVESLDWDGHPAMRRTQVEHRSAGLITTVNVFDPATMAPLMSEQHRSDGLFWRYTYQGQSVTELRSTLRPGNAPLQPSGAHIDTLRRTFTLPTPTYDFFGGMYGILFPRLRLDPGVRDSFPALFQAKDSVIMVAYTVSDRVRINAGRLGTVDAAVVDVPLPGGGSYRFWITKTPPYIMRLASPQASPRGVWSWDIPNE